MTRRAPNLGKHSYEGPVGAGRCVSAHLHKHLHVAAAARAGPAAVWQLPAVVKGPVTTLSFPAQGPPLFCSQPGWFVSALSCVNHSALSGDCPFLSFPSVPLWGHQLPLVAWREIPDFSVTPQQSPLVP